MNEITTCDGYAVARGSRVVAYYATPVQWATIEATDPAGWADVTHDDGTSGYYNGERLAYAAPATGPAAIGPDPLDDGGWCDQCDARTIDGGKCERPSSDACEGWLR